tara:strand:- start:5912 stop:9379 length:3468 start_codon:yes stop_codon:yes gene_type:complete
MEELNIKSNDFESPQILSNGGKLTVNREMMERKFSNVVLEESFKDPSISFVGDLNCCNLTDFDFEKMKMNDYHKEEIADGEIPHDFQLRFYDEELGEVVPKNVHKLSYKDRMFALYCLELYMSYQTTKKLMEKLNSKEYETPSYSKGGGVDDFDWESVFSEPTEQELSKWKAQDKADLIEKKNEYAHSLGYDKKMSWNDIALYLVNDTKQNFENIKGAKEYEDLRLYDKYIKENIKALKKLGYGAEKYAELLEENYYTKNYRKGGGIDEPKSEEEAKKELKALMPRNKFNFMYDRLLKIAPNVIELLKRAEYVSDVYGKSQYRTQDFGGTDALMYVAVEGLEKSGLNRYDLAISHYYIQQGDMMCDPCMTVRIDTEWETMEALTYKMDGVIGRGIIKEVYPAEYDGKKVNLYEKKSQNQFLNLWTSNLVKQGHIVEFESEEEDETHTPTEITAGDIVKRISGGTVRYEVIRTGSSTMDLVSVTDGHEWGDLPIEDFVLVDEDEREIARQTLQDVREKIASTPSLESVRAKYPITIEWSEGFEGANVGFNSLEDLESKLKTIDPPTNGTYVKNKMWFKDYPTYVQIDVGSDSGDFNHEKESLIEYLNRYDEKFNWNQFSKEAKTKEVVEEKIETSESETPKTVDYTKYLGKGFTPALGVKAFKKEDGNLWFIQYKPSTHFSPLDRSLDESRAKYKKALELGFKVKDFKAGKYGIAYILTKGNEALTKDGFESIDAAISDKSKDEFSIDDYTLKVGDKYNDFRYDDIYTIAKISPYGKGSDATLTLKYEKLGEKTESANAISQYLTNNIHSLHKPISKEAQDVVRGEWDKMKDFLGLEPDTDSGITDLEPLTNENPLSTQLKKLTGDSYSAVSFINENGVGLNAEGIIVHIKTGKKYRIPSRNEYFKGIDAEYKNVFTRNKAIEEFLDSKSKDYIFSNEEKSFIVEYEGYGGLEKQGAKGRGLLWEYYTPELLVKKMWGLAYKYGFLTGKVLEPSVGVGNFLNRTSPQDQITAYEISEYSSRICKIVHPTANVINKSFEEHFYNGNVYNPNFEKGFDLVIGNPPYGDYVGKRSKAENKRLRGGISKFEHYFMLRGLDVLKSGGLLIYVSTANLFTKGYEKAKLSIGERAEIVDAYLLPDKTFKNTKINTSLIILRKK